MKKRIMKGIFLLVFATVVLLMGNFACAGVNDIIVVGGLGVTDPPATGPGDVVFQLPADVNLDPNNKSGYVFKLRKNGSVLETKRAIDLKGLEMLEGYPYIEPARSVTVGEIRSDSPGPEILVGNNFGGINVFDFHLSRRIDGWVDDGCPAVDVIVANSYTAEPGNEVMRLTDRSAVGATDWINTLNPSYGQFLWKIVSTQSVGNRFTRMAMADIDPVISGLELATVDAIGWVNVWSRYYNYGFPVMRGYYTGNIELGCDVNELDPNYLGLEIVITENWLTTPSDYNTVISAVTILGRNPNNPYDYKNGLLILRNFRDIIGWTTDVKIAELDSNNSGPEIVAVTSAPSGFPWKGEVLLFDPKPAADPNHITLLATTNLTMPGVIPAGLLSVAVGEIDSQSPGPEIIVGSQEGHVLVFNSNLTALLAETQLFDDQNRPIPIRRIALIPAMPDGDFNVDGVVDTKDLGSFCADWLGTPYVVGAITPTDANLLGWWKFDGDANDSSGHGYNGTPGGDANNMAYITDPCRGKVLALDINQTVGSAWISIPNEPPFDIVNSITISAWIDTNSVSIGNIVGKPGSWTLDKRADAKISFTCVGIGFYWYGTNPLYVASATEVNDGRWHYVAGVYNKSESKMYIYVDGILEGVSPTNPTKSITTNDNLVTIGNGWNGLIDNVRIYNRALSQSEIVSLAEKSKVLQPQIPPPLSDVLLFEDGEVNFKDFAVLADNWLKSAN